MNRQYGFMFLLLVFIICFGFTIGLTYAPCYASLCSEDFFPFDTRMHIVTFYGLIASIAFALCLRAYSSWWYALSSRNLTKRPVRLFDRRFTVGGLLLAIWIVTVTLATTGFWLPDELNFWALRTDALQWGGARIDLAVTGLIGHHIDILLGLVLIPVGRNSILGRVFSLHQSTLLYAHKLLAYLLLVGAFAHGAAYYFFVGSYAAANDDSPRKDAFNIDNPEYTEAQIKRKGYWHAATLATGVISFLLIVVITITALPILRRNSYNNFYYAHIICGSLLFISASIHCSTDFYFLLPGLILWLSDWVWRFFRGDTGLRTTVTGELSVAEGGWCRITLPAVQQLPTGDAANESANVDAIEKRQSLVHPLQTFYLNIPAISKFQNHAFTTAKVGTTQTGPLFLFQRTQLGIEKKKPKKLEKEWTWKATAAANDRYNGSDQDSIEDSSNIEVRVEGPYVPTEVNGFETADVVICVVGGTGLTGAYSLALWWLEARARESGSQFVLIWTVRNRDTAELFEWKELVKRTSVASSNVRVILHVSSEQGRLDVSSMVREQLATTSQMNETDDKEEPSQKRTAGRSAWVYASGPAGLLTSTDNACVDIENELRKARKARRKDNPQAQSAIDNFSHYVARWEV